MTDVQVANRYVFSDEGTEVSLTAGMAGEPVASISVGGEQFEVEVEERETHWMLRCVTETVHDERRSRMRVRVPVVHLSGGESQPVTALLTVVTSHTSLAGPAGVSGPLESYQARVITGEASQVEPFAGGEPGGQNTASAVHEYRDLVAICDHEPGGSDPRRIRVKGTVVFRQSGCSVDALPDSRTLALELRLDQPEGPASDVLDPVEFEYVADTDGVEYEQVSFRVVGTDDAAPSNLEVVHPQ